MVDREKVIRAVDSCFDYWLDQHRCLNPLELEHVRQYKAEALALLKEQEAIKPYAQGDGSYACNNCGETVGCEEMNCGGISVVKYKFCPECGMAVKWE